MSESQRATQEKIDQAQAKARGLKHKELEVQLEAGQLVFWPDSERGVPNELVRCAVFSAKNHKQPRATYKAASPLVIPIVGGGEIVFVGEELRQDDETVWMQLVHMAKESRSVWVSFTPYSFFKALGWGTDVDSYKRLLASLRRLSGAGVEVYSSRFDRGVRTRLLGDFTYSKKATGGAWTVKVFDQDTNMLTLFDSLYSRLDWETRLALPAGVATWLHGFFASHRQPFDHKVETLARGAGLTLETPDDDLLDEAARTAKRQARLREAKKTIKRGLEALKARGFLSEYEVTRTGLVRVVRANRKAASE